MGEGARARGVGAEVAEVAVPRDVDRTFDYAVPEALRDRVAVGMRVRVPFRNETVTGFVVQLKAGSDYPGRLLAIEALVDEAPVLDARALTLARWLGDYYATPLGLVLPTLAPAGVRSAPAREERTRPHARLRVPLAQALRLLDELSAGAPQQAALLRELLALGDAVPVQELLARVSCSDAPLRALARKGFITIERRPVPRPPAAVTTALQSADAAAERTLTDDQHRAIQTIRRGLARGHGRYLLFGVNASGKTEVYLQSVQSALAQGRGAIVVVPEIALTPQLLAHFRARLGEETVAVYHSGLTGAQRAREWLRAQRGEARVVVGVRAAVFAPVRALGLIVLDEEHEPTYKQDDPAPRYHAREVALQRAQLERAVVILGSATPSLESFYRAERGGLQLVELRERAVPGPPPDVHIVDLKGETVVLSPALKRALAQRLKRGEQALLLLNLRGFARAVLCRTCRETQRCPRCGIALVYHLKGQRLRCHVCGGDFPTGRCRACGSRDLAFLGAGTQQAELALREAFPSARIARMDSDAVRRGQHVRILEAFRKGEIDILLGTQMIGLGLDFPNVTLVGVLSADALLSLPDFRAGERTFQLISQAIGRAGRGPKGGLVLIQTNHPEHYAVQQAARGDYRAFYEEELITRRALNYPPFTHLIKLTISDRKAERAERGAKQLAEALQGARLKGLEVLGPFRALPARVRGEHRWQLVLKTRHVPATNALIRELRADPALKLKSLNVKIDVDPQSLLG